jgi:exodeoxyribonuclease VII large subunit
MGQLARQQLEDKEYEIDQMLQRLARVHPRRRFDEWLQRLDDLQVSLSRCVKQGTRDQKIAWRNLQERLLRVRPRQLLQQRRELLQQEQRRLLELAQHQLQNFQNGLSTLETRLRLLGPEQVLARGYSITMDAATGKVIRVAIEVKAGQRLRTLLKEGEITSKAAGE